MPPPLELWVAGGAAEVVLAGGGVGLRLRRGRGSGAVREFVGAFRRKAREIRRNVAAQSTPLTGPQQYVLSQRA